MTPNKLKIATLRQLREARACMLDLEYLIGLEKLKLEERKKAALNLSNVQLAHLKLRAEKLAEIREKLEENNDDLKAGIKDVSETLKNLSDVKAIIDVVGGFLQIVARIIPLVL